MVAGKREVADPSILRHLQEMHDLEAFCFRHGIRIDRLCDARNLVWFARTKKIPMKEFSKAAPWVDVADANFVKPPSRRESASIYLFAGALLGLAMFAVSVGDSRSAMLTTRESRVTFLANSNGIRSPFSRDVSVFGWQFLSPWAVPKPACEDDAQVLARTAGFTEDESKAICAAMFDGSLSEQVDKSVKFQRRAAGLFSVIFMICASVLLLHVLRGVSARRLLKRILEANQ